MIKLNRVSGNSPSTISGIIMLTALATTPAHSSHANYFNQAKSDNNIIMSKSSQTFSDVLEVKLVNTEDLLVRVFEKMSRESRPLEEDFARILSEDMFDLF